MRGTMEYTLLDKITITRPILFLCGPYYEKSNKSDRRVILQNMLYDTYKNKYLPLVIDDFLTEKNIRDDNISIQIMEEICAAVSYKTYIFLDTMSSATELGIFANSAYVNEISVFVPKASDIYNRKNVGYFVHDVVLKKHEDRVKCLEYRPGLERRALATDYVVEHYKFVNDSLPSNLARHIKEDPIFGQEDSHPINLREDDVVIPQTPYQICCQRKGNSLTVSISLRLLFYVTVSIISHEYKTFLQSGDEDFSKFDIDDIVDKVNQCIKNFISGKTGKDLSACVIAKLNTVLQEEERTLVYHIAKFVHVYYLYSQFHRFYLVEKPLGNVVDKIAVGNHPYTLCGLKEKDITLLEKIQADQEKYFEQIIVRKNKKKREIIKYREDKNGDQARELHNRMLQGILEYYTANQASYAYRRGRGIKQCVQQHLDGVDFMKYDIRKFFNSIGLEKLTKCFGAALKIDERFFKELYRMLGSCFYHGTLPLGLVLSPILSDIYMNEFDRRAEGFFSSLGFTYTRYADDILVSAKEVMEEEAKEKEEEFVERELKRLSLSINREKVRRARLEKQGDQIRYVGLYIVRGEKENFITVGKSYAYETARECLDYFHKIRRLLVEELPDAEKEKLEKDTFFERRILLGKLGFMEQMEGQRGIDRVEARLKAHGLSILEI